MMKKRSPRLLALFSAAALLMSGAAAYSLEEKEVPAATPQPVETAPVPAYLVRELNGCIAVFSGDGADLLRRTDYPAAALPLADRQGLEAGIPVDSDEALAMLLEDYQS